MYFRRLEAFLVVPNSAVILCLTSKLYPISDRLKTLSVAWKPMCQPSLDNLSNILVDLIFQLPRTSSGCMNPNPTYHVNSYPDQKYIVKSKSLRFAFDCPDL